MVLGLYYITKMRKGTLGEGLVFYGPEEATIAYNEKKVDIHAPIKVYVDNVEEDGKLVRKMIETSIGRLMVNEFVPFEVGYINEVLGKKSLRDIIGKVIKICGVARTAQFLDDIKNLGYYMAFKGGLSFNLADVLIPPEKDDLVKEGYDEVEQILANYSMGFITFNERYNQIIDTWTHVNSKLSNILMKQLTNDNDGFNSVFMMMDSGARGSKEQIRQLSGMRGLMAKPQKSGAEGGQIIENPILSNFKEGLSVLEYFISTHGARKGLADTALKTADAGYLTRRLVDVSHDVIINEEYRTDFHTFDRRILDQLSSVFANFFTGSNNQFTSQRMLDIMNRYTSQDTFIQRSDNFFVILQFRTNQTTKRTTVFFIDDNVMRYVYQTTSQVTGIGSYLQRTLQPDYRYLDTCQQ